MSKCWIKIKNVDRSWIVNKTFFNLYRSFLLTWNHGIEFLRIHSWCYYYFNVLKRENATETFRRICRQGRVWHPLFYGLNKNAWTFGVLNKILVGHEFSYDDVILVAYVQDKVSAPLKTILAWLIGGVLSCKCWCCNVCIEKPHV